MEDYKKYLPITMETANCFEPWFYINDNYQISLLGRIKSLNYNRTGKTKILKLQMDKYGYLRCLKGYKKVHRLLYMAIHGEIPDGMVVDHRNFIRDDNRLFNLRLLSRSENSSRKSDKGIASISAKWEDDNFRLKQAESVKRKWEDCGFRKKHAEGVKQKWQDSNFKQKKSMQMKQKWLDEDFRLRNAEAVKRTHNIPVLQYDKQGNFIAEYHSIREAEIKTGVANQHISHTCKGKRKSAGGFKWKYKYV